MIKTEFLQSLSLDREDYYDDEDETQVNVDTSYWIYDEENERFTFSKPIQVPTQEKVTTFEVLSQMEFLNRMNSEKRREISDFQFTPHGEVFVESVIKKPVVMVEEIPAPKVDLPAGIFTFSQDMKGWGLSQYQFSTDEYIDLSGHTKAIEEDIETFLSKKEHYHKQGLLWKRGILLAGPQGNGKTVLLEHLAKKFNKRARIIFGLQIIHMLKYISQKMDDLPIILVAEEFTDHNPHNLLSHLDGEESIDGLLTIFTTNYPQNIPMNIVDRPGRLDSIYEVGLPDEATRTKYLQGKLGKKVSKAVIKQSEGLSIAYLRELVVASQIYEKSFEEVFEDFKERKKRIQRYADMRKNPNPDRVWEIAKAPKVRK